jgi:glycosidase
MLAAAVEAGKLPYSFADNHDVSRVASTLTNPGHIFPLYALLWTMPGIPSVYYGSEYGLQGDKKHGDSGLRPPRDEVIRAQRTDTELAAFISELNRVRSLSEALRIGGYRQVAVQSTLLAFERFTDDARVLVAVNIDSGPTELAVGEPGRYECLFSGEEVVVDSAHPIPVPAYGARVLRRR